MRNVNKFINLFVFLPMQVRVRASECVVCAMVADTLSLDLASLYSFVAHIFSIQSAGLEWRVRADCRQLYYSAHDSRRRYPTSCQYDEPVPRFHV